MGVIVYGGIITRRNSTGEKLSRENISIGGGGASATIFQARRDSIMT